MTSHVQLAMKSAAPAKAARGVGPIRSGRRLSCQNLGRSHVNP
jgi:hypothetical protein